MLKKIIISLYFTTSLVHTQNTVTDIDGNSYDYLTYGTQQWTVENAAMENYRDGTPIPQVTDATQWTNLTTGAWCYYENDPTKGKLYNWYAVAGIHDNDPNTPNKEFAPEGWHVPTDDEWTTLEEHLIANGYNYDGTTSGNKIAKAMASTSGWNSSTTVGSPGNNQSLNNSSAFNALPIGIRSIDGSYSRRTLVSNFWTSSNFDNNNSWYSVIDYNKISLDLHNDNLPHGGKGDGYSVRFVQDNNSCSEVSISSSATEVCAGESVDLTVSSGLTAGTTACTSTDLPANLQNGLVGYWPFCGNANDESGNGNNGTVNGANLTTDRFGNTDSAYSFDGNDDFIEISLTQYNSFTVSLWFYQNEMKPYNGIFQHKSNCDYAGGYILEVRNDKLRYYSNYCDVCPSGCSATNIYEFFNSNNTPININQWYNLIVSSDNGEISFYLDGELLLTQINPNINSYGTQPFSIGKHHDGNDDLYLFNGIIDDIIYYNTPLDVTQVLQLYNLNNSSFTWYTGETTETITVSPTETTEYWVDVTTNGVTCREYITIDVTAPEAPTGDAQQTFCEASTVADLTATGENIQWYDAATGGNLLDSSTALTDGQIVYASQTVNGCESTDRLEVTVSIQDITITASAAEVCSGDEVTLSLNNGTPNNEIFIGEHSLSLGSASSHNFDVTIGQVYRLEIQGNWTWGTYCPQLAYDPAYILQGFYQASNSPIPWDMACNDGMYASIFCENPNLRPTPDIYNDQHAYSYFFTASSNQVTVGFSDTIYGDNCGGATFRLYESSYANQVIWSTGDTTENITVTPNETTEYWVDVTTNGVTCREYITIDVTAPAAPTGDTQQTFCEASTVADLTVTGENIQWYDAAIGGNLLDTTTALTDGQMVYASQTIDGCESEDRLAVTVSIQDITITASATEVCSGESLDLTVSSGSTSFVEGNLIGELNHTITTNIEQNFATQIGLNYRLEITGNFSWGTYCPNLAWDPAYTLTGFYGAQEPTPREMLCDSGVYSSIFCDTPGLRPIPDVYNDLDHTYNYYFVANSISINVGFQDGNALGDNCGTIRYRLYENSTPANSSTYAWSTGDTTANISVTPTETTEYWVDVTTNGVTCREYITIDVTAPEAPTGDAQQTFCSASAIADLSATGENIQWYDAATGGNLLDSTTALTDGQMVYASQTVDGCESEERLEVTVSIQDIIITASATEVCAGESIDLTVSSGSTSFVEGNLIGELNHTITTNVEQNFATQIGVNYRLEITGNFSWGTYCPDLARDPAYTLTGFYGAQQPTPLDMVCYSNTGSPYSSIFCDTPGLRPIPDVYDDLEHSYDYYFVGNSNSINVGFQDGNALGDNCGTIRFRLYENSTPADFSSFTWSTGDTTETISVTPSQTTEYWVDVTTNGLTCREYITIDVTAPEAPTGDAQQTFCEASTVADLTATGENIQWYDAATGGNLLDATTSLTDGQIVYASQTVNGCESTDRLAVTVSIQEITITASATEICSGEEVTIGIEYEIPTICDMDITLTNIPFGDEIPGFTYAGFYNEHHYYVYNTPTSWTEGEQICRENGGYLVCINDEPENTFVSNLTNNNIWIGMFRDPDTCEFRWLDCIDITYTNWRPGEPNSGPCGEPYVQIIRGCSFGYNTWNNLSDNASNGACYSNMVPIMEIDPSIYEGNIITQSTFIWSTGDTTENITVTPNETTEYWVDVTTNGVTCREYITVTVNDLPNIPVSNGDITECETTATQNLVATATVNTGESITWYDDATGGNIVAETSLNSAGTVTYYAEAVDDTSGCVSLTRTAVTLTIESAPNAPESGGDITACETIAAQNLVATATVNSGESITWYDDATGGNIVTDPSLNAAGTVTYYAEAVDDTSGCVSLTRTAVTLTIESAPDQPVSGGDITACETIAAQNLVATATVNSGESITWYDDATGVNIVADPSLSTAGTVTYYAEAVNDISGCVSLTRTAVTLTITSVEAPTGDVVQSFCDSVTVADLSAAGSNIQWYDAATGGNNLDLNSGLSDGQVLYASQTVDGCESITRLEVSVEIDIIPDPILITTQLEFCLAKEATLADLEIDNQGFTLEWYDSFSGGNMLPIDTSLENGVSYYATLYDVSSGCESLMRLEVVPTVIPCEVKIYNALSLNDDGKNDYMVIENIEYYPINTLEVYNRNGQLVFETDNYGQYNNYFYGKANVNGVVSPSSKLPTGSYLYVFKYFDSFLTQERVVLKGFLTINSN